MVLAEAWAKQEILLKQGAVWYQIQWKKGWVLGFQKFEVHFRHSVSMLKSLNHFKHFIIVSEEEIQQ